jgi:hypothetical protein
MRPVAWYQKKYVAAPNSAATNSGTGSANTAARTTIRTVIPANTAAMARTSRWFFTPQTRDCGDVSLSEEANPRVKQGPCATS